MGNLIIRGVTSFALIVAFVGVLSVLPISNAYSAGVWTNEPPGANVVLDCPFNSTAGCGIFDVYSSSIQELDSSAPVSPSGVVKSTIYSGNLSGGMQLGYTTPQMNREIYVGFMWRTNPQFYGRPQHDKMFFIRGAANKWLFWNVYLPRLFKSTTGLESQSCSIRRVTHLW